MGIQSLAFCIPSVRAMFDCLLVFGRSACGKLDFSTGGSSEGVQGGMFKGMFNLIFFLSIRLSLEGSHRLSGCCEW